MQPTSESSIFLAAIEKTSAAERAAYLDEVCAGNPQLRGEVEALLAAHERLPAAGAEAAVTGGATLGPPVPPTAVGTVIGRYKLLEVIGEGGFGTVYMAEQEQ